MQERRLERKRELRKGRKQVNKEDITQAFTKAKQLVGGIEERYQELALTVVFRWLLEQSAGVAKAAAPSVATDIEPSMALNEFLASKKPESHIDRVLLVAYYYQHSRNEPTTRAELSDAYTIARMSRPQNLSDIIGKCARKGYLTEYLPGKEDKRAWQITQTGEKYLQEVVKA